MCSRNQFLTGLEQLGITLGDQAVERLLLYCSELQKWNRKINLVARDTPSREIVEKHFLDSLTLLPLLARHGSAGASLLDVGSGAGFPGLALAAAMPELRATLLEPRQKRTAFLRHMVRTMELSNVHVREERLELDQTLPDQFAFITSRALASPAVFLSMIEQVASESTLVVLMQAADERQFLSDCPAWEAADGMKLVLPFSGHPRSLLAVRKRKLAG